MFVIRVVLKVLLLKHIWWMSSCPSVPCILEMSSLVAPVEAEVKMVLDVECLVGYQFLTPNDVIWFMRKYGARSKCS